MTLMPDARTAIVDKVVKQYLDSDDFNGVSVGTLNGDDQKLVPALIEEGLLDLVRGDGHPNPHIKALPADAVEDQLQKIRELGLGDGCLYPTPAVLEKRVDRRKYRGRPFSLEIALGGAQLSFRAFDPRVLEWYRNDPRFSYQVDDIHGSIYFKDEGSSSHTLSKDHFYLEHFGFAYDEEQRRAVAVFLWDLHKLRPEDQRHWNEHIRSTPHTLHPDYFRTSILGQFPDGVSIFDAFLHEKHHINEMCKEIGWSPMFKSNHEAYQRPDGFGFMIRPTRKELSDFYLKLDQLMSDDIDQTFFKGMEIEIVGKTDDGREVRQRKGTITLLEEWIGQNFRPKDKEPLTRLLKTFRDIRKLRSQHAAHNVTDNDFNEDYLIEQRDAIKKAYIAIRTIRLMIKNHPKLREYEVEEWLQSGRIWTK